MRRRRQFEMAWNDDDRLKLVDWNAKHARRSFTVVVVLVYWAALWPLVAAGYCHNRSSKLDAAAAAAAAEEKLLNLRRVPRNSGIKKKEDKRELPDGKENTTDLQKTETKSCVAEKDKRRSKSREEEEEEEEEQQLQKQKVQTDYEEEVGREKLRTVDTNPPGNLGILHPGWRAYKEDRALQRSTRKREGPGCGIFSHLYSILPLLFCSSTAQLRLSRASLVFHLEHSARLYVCLFFELCKWAQLWRHYHGQVLICLFFFFLSLACLSVCLQCFFFCSLFLYFASLLPSPLCAPFKFRKALSFTTVESRIACARVGHKVHTINGGGSPLQVSLLFCFSSLLFACCYRATTTSANWICCNRDNTTNNNNKRFVVASLDRFFEVTTVQV